MAPKLLAPRPLRRRLTAKTPPGPFYRVRPAGAAEARFYVAAYAVRGFEEARQLALQAAQRYAAEAAGGAPPTDAGGAAVCEAPEAAAGAQAAAGAPPAAAGDGAAAGAAAGPAGAGPGPGRAAGAPAPAARPAPARVIRVARVARQSGVPGVTWHEACGHWEVKAQKRDGTGRVRETFTVKQYSAPGRSAEKAIEAARRAAAARLAELVQRGVARAPAAKKQPEHRSDVPGVSWRKDRSLWHVRVQADGKRVRRDLRPDSMTPAAIDRARLEAERVCREFRDRLGVRAEVSRTEAKRVDELVKRESGAVGVIWRMWENCWRAHPLILGKKRVQRFRPASGAPAAIEAARVEAVAYCDALRRAKTVEETVAIQARARAR